MKKGRIGLGKRVHIVAVQSGDLGVALCGWTGNIKPTKERVDCKRCLEKRK